MNSFSLISIVKKAVLTAALALLVLAAPARAQIDLSQLDQFRPDVVRLVPPGGLGDTINVWGTVRLNGRFLVPRGTTVTEMLSYTGGPSLQTTRIGGSEIRGVFDYYSLQQVEVYVNRYDESNQQEIVETWTYRLSDPFPEGMRRYHLQNGEYVTVNIRRRPTTLQYVVFGVSIIGSLAGSYFLLERIFD
ncbi:MAG: hypothetical protein ACQETM_07835 [Bacteroidota bacterium]